jgi:pimeloyl-ACP methyl ester carboxylesterase
MIFRSAKSSQVLGLDNVSVHFQRYGDGGPRVVLVHAIGFDHRTWEPILPALAGYEVVAVDLPGHGESGKPHDVDYGPYSLGSRMIRLLDELGWESAAFIGNSLGGGTSLAAALQAPERVKALALLNSVAFQQALPPLGRLASVPLVPHLSRIAPHLAVKLGLESCRHRWGSVSTERCTASRSYLRSAEGHGAFFRALRQLYGGDLSRMAEHYSEITCPTLVLHGERDPLIRLPHAAQLAETIPHAQFARLPHCGHFPQEECPEEVAKALRPFLEEVLGPKETHAETFPAASHS